ncbi:hypothetical protein G9U51_06620 [Calidifontibacter sp. DB0510]|uniref:Uncharacterized protein n=1 Tax=Metallococcus carri TaxID=1656884 RepID=A0A967EE93_9MICO|nr:hypothetical protein [Metallococcus carri]NHN55456.1 hypothetical protein [Metallococcus carri]NOP38360.1 hypothetical protein [Calidifontibacter sp. DB2511S]
MIARTLSGNAPPLTFLITLWALTVIFLALAVVGAVAWWRGRSTATPEQRGKLTCLTMAGIPAGVVGLFLLNWAIGVTW